MLSNLVQCMAVRRSNFVLRRLFFGIALDLGFGLGLGFRSHLHLAEVMAIVVAVVVAVVVGVVDVSVGL